MKKEVELTEEHKIFLEVLRETGKTNMFGASPYLVEEFGLNKYEARNVLKQWMKNPRGE